MTITMSSAHSPNFPSLQQHHSSFSNPSVALPTSSTLLLVHLHHTCTLLSPGEPPTSTKSCQMLNNLWVLTRGFKANTGALLWFNFYSAGWKKLQEVFKVCVLYLIILFTSSCHCLSDMLGLCLIWSNVVNIRLLIFCLVLTGLMYTTLFTCLQRKKSRVLGREI